MASRILTGHGRVTMFGAAMKVRRVIAFVVVGLVALAWVSAKRGAWTATDGQHEMGDYFPPHDAGALESAGVVSLAAGSCITQLGTSLTANGKRWFEQVGKLAEEVGIECGFRRLGGAGENSSWGVLQLSEIPANTRVLIIEFCMNDAALHHGITPAKSIANHEQLIRECRARGITPVLSTMSPAVGAVRLKRPWLANYHEIYRDLARRHSVALLDTVPDWDQALAAKGKALIPDGTHPTDAAMTERYAPRLVEFLSRLPLEDLAERKAEDR